MSLRSLLFIFMILSGTLGCTRSLEWKTEEWQGEGKVPLPSSVSRTMTKTGFQTRDVEFRVQQVAGVKVDGSYAKLVERKSAKLTEGGAQTSWARSRFIQPSDLPTPQQVERSLKSKKSALKIAERKISSLGCRQQSSSLSQAEPLLQWTGGKWKVVYRGICETSLGKVYEFTINERGAVSDIQSAGSSFTSDFMEVNATLYPKGPKTSQLKALKLALASQPNFLFNPILDTVSDAGVKISGLDQVPSIKSPDPRFDLLQVYYYANGALTWFSRVFAFQAQSLKVRTHVGYPEKTNAAFYFNREVRLGVGDGQAYSHLSWDPSIVIHEVMHSAIDTLVHLPFKGEGGSLNEAIADSLTALYLNSPRMGENSYQNGPYQRTLENALTFNDRTGKLYADSLILSGTIWEIGQKTDPSVALQLIEYLLTYLVPTSDFSEAKALMGGWFTTNPADAQRTSVEAILKQRGWL